MIALIWFVLAVLASPFKSKSRLEAENAVLRHQLIVLRRRLKGRVGSQITTAGSSSIRAPPVDHQPAPLLCFLKITRTGCAKISTIEIVGHAVCSNDRFWRKAAAHADEKT
jgi:hypothetical protein